jgi:hypothetical protein
LPTNDSIEVYVSRKSLRNFNKYLFPKFDLDVAKTRMEVDMVHNLLEENEELSECFNDEIVEKAGLLRMLFGQLFLMRENCEASHYWEVCYLNMSKCLSKLFDLIPRWDGKIYSWFL